MFNLGLCGWVRFHVGDDKRAKGGGHWRTWQVIN